MNLLIVEDEASIMDRLVRLSRTILGPRLRKLETAGSIDQARIRIADALFDIVLLDLNLNGKDGFDILKEFSARSFQTIVVSAHTRRAIEAYEHGVVDFVPKPFDEARLARAFGRAAGAARQDSHFAKFLAVRSAGRIELIGLEEIEYIQADGPCSLIAKTDGSQRAHDKMLKNIALLLPAHFDRVHKSYLANLRAITGLRAGPDHRNVLTFPSGREIPLSRRKAKELRSTLDQPK